MRARTPSRPLALLLLGLAPILVVGARSAAPRPHQSAGVEDALERAQLEQELILAERTAVMIGELERALRSMASTTGRRTVPASASRAAGGAR